MPRSILLPLAALLACAACESSPELPTELTGPPPFSRIVFDQLTLSPAPGSQLNAGQTIQYRADAFFELAPEDLVQNPWKSATALVEAWAAEEDYYSEGDWVETWTALKQGATAGTLSLAGTLTVPPYSPDCTPYDEIHLSASLGTSATPQQRSDKSPGSGFEARVKYPVVGVTGTSEPCVSLNAWSRNYDYWPGDDVTLYVKNVRKGQSVEVRFGQGPPAPLGRQLYWSMNPELWLDVWIPPGSTEGPLQVLVNGKPALAGGNVPNLYSLPDPTMDTGDPYNDVWNAWWRDYGGLAETFFYNPALMMSTSDRKIDPKKNPFGWSGYGVGDWWAITWDQESDLCVEATSAPEDRIALFLTTIGNLLPFETREISPGRVRLETGLLIPPPGQSGQIEIWAAPIDVRTALGAYKLVAAPCAWFGSGNPTPSPAGAPVEVRGR